MRKINWAIPGLLAMLLIIGGLALIQSLSATSPDPAKLATQCSACHTMDDHVTTWQASSHKDVACTDCHADPGVRGWLEMQLGQLRMLTTSKRDPHFDISQVATEVPNERCINCHAREMPWVMQDLEPPELDENGEPIRVEKDQLAHFPALAGHDLHLTLDEPLACTACHSAVSHGPKERPDQVEAWHNTCLECHAQEKVAMSVRTSISCSACHSDLTLVSPEDHRQADFRTAHGDAATTDVQSCQQCHLTPGLATLNPGDQPPAAHFQPVIQPRPHPTVPAMPAGSLKVTEGMKDACASCHGVTMPHPENWLTNHTEGFKEKPELCASCHGTRDQGFKVQVVGNPRTLSTTDASCTGCHAQPMPHPENWVAEGHFTQARVAPQTCAQCHSAANEANPTAAHASPQFCLDCHLAKFAHPANYIASHGSVALAANGQISADCTTCHTETVNTCADCHSAGFGQGVKQQWHPPMFWISHARTTKPEDINSCKSCHNYVEPTCAKCHREY